MNKNCEHDGYFALSVNLVGVGYYAICSKCGNKVFVSTKSDSTHSLTKTNHKRGKIMRSKMSRGKLTDQEVRAIRKAKGTLEELGKLFGMTKSSIQRIKKGQSYAGVK